MGLVQSEIPEFPGAGTTLKIFKSNCMNVSVFLTSMGPWLSTIPIPDTHRVLYRDSFVFSLFPFQIDINWAF